MTIIKYTRTGSARFISHIDVLRHMARIMRRAGIPVKFSQGFNPHELIYYSPPTGLGIGSLAEYVAVETDMAAEECFERYNRSVNEDMKAVACFSAERNPNLAGRTTAADYIFPTAYIDLALGDSLNVSYTKKGEALVEDVRKKIFNVFDADGKLGLRLAVGNTTLRADVAAKALSQNFGIEINFTDIIKTAQYMPSDAGFVDVDCVLKGEK